MSERTTASERIAAVSDKWGGRDADGDALEWLRNNAGEGARIVAFAVLADETQRLATAAERIADALEKRNAWTVHSAVFPADQRGPEPDEASDEPSPDATADEEGWDPLDAIAIGGTLRDPKGFQGLLVYRDGKGIRCVLKQSHTVTRVVWWEGGEAHYADVEPSHVAFYLPTPSTLFRLVSADGTSVGNRLPGYVREALAEVP
jgi:hypothetical protein